MKDIDERPDNKPKAKANCDEGPHAQGQLPTPGPFDAEYQIGWDKKEEAYRCLLSKDISRAEKLKSFKQESISLMMRAKQKLMDDLKKELETKKREREEAEENQKETERRVKEKIDKLEKIRKEVEKMKTLENRKAP